MVSFGDGDEAFELREPVENDVDVGGDGAGFAADHEESHTAPPIRRDVVFARVVLVARNKVVPVDKRCPDTPRGPISRQIFSHVLCPGRVT